MLTLAGLAPWTPAAPCLALTLASEVIDLISVDIEDDLASARVLVLDDQLCACALSDLRTGEIRNEDRLSCHKLLLFVEEDTFADRSQVRGRVYASDMTTATSFANACAPRRSRHEGHPRSN
jgi:hypothetical protein